MEQDKLDYDSDIVICDDIPETIIVTSSPEKCKSKTKKAKKRKRKVERAIGCDNMEKLLITQKFQMKKTKFKCVININRVFKERKSDSIIRFDMNVCKKEAYYHRILPVCLRRVCQNDIARSCSGLSSCSLDKVYKHEVTPKSPKCVSLSPVSSVALTDIFGCNNISYEDVSNGNFSSTSEEELDTLIKRTRQREKHFELLNSVRRCVSTPMSKTDDIASPSPYSVEMDKSIHSDTTMVLNTLSSEAYSPDASMDAFNIVNFERTDGLTMIDNVNHYPTMEPVKNQNAMESWLMKSRTNSCVEDNIPYPPAYTLESMEIEKIDFEPITGNHSTLNECNNMPYSPTFTPDWEHSDYLIGDANHYNDTDELYSQTITQNCMKIEEFKRARAVTENVAYSPSSPTMSPDLKKMVDSTNNNFKEANSANVTLYRMKVENIDYEPEVIRSKESAPDSAASITESIKNENTTDCYAPPDLNVTDSNINNTCKKEKEDSQSVVKCSQVVANKVVVKVEKDEQNIIFGTEPEHFSASTVETAVFTNSTTIKSEGTHVKTEFK